MGGGVWSAHMDYCKQNLSAQFNNYLTAHWAELQFLTSLGGLKDVIGR